MNSLLDDPEGSASNGTVGSSFQYAVLTSWSSKNFAT